MNCLGEKSAKVPQDLESWGSGSLEKEPLRTQVGPSWREGVEEVGGPWELLSLLPAPSSWSEEQVPMGLLIIFLTSSFKEMLYFLLFRFYVSVCQLTLGNETFDPFLRNLRNWQEVGENCFEQRNPELQNVCHVGCIISQF